MFHKLLASFLLLFGLTACGLFASKEDYSNAQKLPDLAIPPDMTSPNYSQTYRKPATDVEGTAKYSTYISRGSAPSQAVTASQNAGTQAAENKVQWVREGNQRWLLVPLPREVLWPKVKKFWGDMGMKLKVELPQTGIMVTDWLESRADVNQGGLREALKRAFGNIYASAEREQFRTRLEPGKKPGTTEVYISARNLVEIYVDEGRSDTRWQHGPDNDGRAIEKLQFLMVALGVEAKAAKEQIASKDAAPLSRAQLVTKSNGNQVVVLSEAMDIAWSRVGDALDKLNAGLQDRNRTQGLYLLRVLDAENSKPNYEDSLANLSNSKHNTHYVQLRLVVKDAGGERTVGVYNAEGSPDTSAAAKKLIAQLYQKLQ